jgi:molybdate transport system substrate-binding protein
MKADATYLKMTKTILFLLLFSTVGYSQGKQNKLLIGAASDLKFALDSIIAVFEQSNVNVQIDVTYGSSGKLYEQISNDAPFDIFFSADSEYPMKLRRKGLSASAVQRYGVGRLVVWSKKIDPTISGINSLLDESVVKIAIANPAHAPYGRRALEALKYYNIHEQIKDRLVYGENISQTAQFVTTGAADMGIVALSLALSPAMEKQKGHYYLVPEVAHNTLEQAFVVLKHGENNSLVTRFVRFMGAEEATRILEHFGFTKRSPGIND